MKGPYLLPATIEWLNYSICRPKHEKLDKMIHPQSKIFKHVKHLKHHLNHLSITVSKKRAICQGSWVPISKSWLSASQPLLHQAHWPRLWPFGSPLPAECFCCRAPRKDPGASWRWGEPLEAPESETCGCAWTWLNEPGITWYRCWC